MRVKRFNTAAYKIFKIIINKINSSFRTNGFYVWFPTILNSLANHEGGETSICAVLDASKVAAANSTEVSQRFLKIIHKIL